jgi:hypothetical protein
MMSGWVKAHIDNTGDTVYLNLDHAVRIEQQSPGSTLVEFPNGPRIVGVSEAPDELLRRIGWVDSIQERRPGDPMPFRANLDILRSLRMIFGRPVTIQPQNKSAAMH